MADESPVESPESGKGELVPQPHGGAIRRGGTNAGGPGRPPSRIKEALRKDFDERLPLLREIADGVVRLRIVPTCPECGHESNAMTEAEIRAVFPQVADRLRALELMAKLGGLDAVKLPEDELLRDLAQAVVEVYGGERWPEVEARWVDVLSRRIG